VFDQGHLLIGHYRAVWNGKGSNGQPVPAGEYKYVITVTDYFTNFDIPIIDTDTQYTGYITVGNNATLTPSLATTASSFAYIPANYVDPNTPTVPISPAPLSIIELQIGNPVFKLNNQAMLLDSPPVIKNDRTLLPIRAVVETMGGQVNWNAEEKRVDIEYRGKTVTLWIGKNTAKVNGKEVMIDPSNPNVVPEIINGRTMLPLRFVAESLGCQVEWDDKTKTITIRFPSY